MNEFENDLAHFNALEADADARRAHAPDWRDLPDGLERGLPIDAPRPIADPRVHQGLHDDDGDPLRGGVSARLAWTVVFGLGLGAAMAGFVLRHRVELLVDRWL